jgi:hypothetical protein
MEVHLMTDMMSGVENAEDSKPPTRLDGLDEQLVAHLVSCAKAGGLQLIGEGGVLTQPTKRLLGPHSRARSLGCCSSRLPQLLRGLPGGSVMAEFAAVEWVNAVFGEVR